MCLVARHAGCCTKHSSYAQLCTLWPLYNSCALGHFLCSASLLHATLISATLPPFTTLVALGIYSHVSPEGPMEKTSLMQFPDAKESG